MTRRLRLSPIPPAGSAAHRAYLRFWFSFSSGLVTAAIVAATLYLVWGVGPDRGLFWLIVGFPLAASLALEISGRVYAARAGSDWRTERRAITDRMDAEMARRSSRDAS